MHIVLNFTESHDIVGEYASSITELEIQLIEILTIKIPTILSITILQYITKNIWDDNDRSTVWCCYIHVAIMVNTHQRKTFIFADIANCTVRYTRVWIRATVKQFIGAHHTFEYSP